MHDVTLQLQCSPVGILEIGMMFHLLSFCYVGSLCESASSYSFCILYNSNVYTVL